MKCKKILAFFLTAVMLMTLMPAMALADGEEIIYNLLDQPVTVGTDETPYEADGGYTIQLEDDAFFPYEVQFTYNGQSWSEWFMTPDDTVTVGGHEFRVVSDSVNDDLLTQIGITVGGKYIPVYPEEKTFSDNHGIQLMTMLPIRSTYLSADMSSVLFPELSSVKISTIFSRGNIEGPAADKEVLLAERGTDNFVVLDENRTIDLTTVLSYSYSFELIVGSADQLDTQNEHYKIQLSNVYGGDYRKYDDMFSINAYEASDSGRVEILDEHFINSDLTFYDVVGFYCADARTLLPTFNSDGEYYLGLFPGSRLSERDDISIEVYSSMYYTEEKALEANAENITDQIMSPADLQSGGGYKIPYSDLDNTYDSQADIHDLYANLTIVLKKDSEVLITIPVQIRLFKKSVSTSPSSVFKRLDDGEVDNNLWRESSYSYDRESDSHVYTYTLREGNAVDEEYYCFFGFIENDYVEDDMTEIKKYVKKSVVGSYETLEEAAEQPDITEQLFTRLLSPDVDSGYKADYSNGVTFTIFYTNTDEPDSEIVRDHYTVKTKAYDGASTAVPGAPVPDSSDTYFHVDSVSEKSTYVMPADADSYYYNGFQTVFVLDHGGSPVTDDTITPRFTLGNKVKVSASLTDGESTTEMVSGETAVPFESGKAIQYSAAAEDGENLKNYWVTFLTQQSGAKLFVNGVNGPAAADGSAIPEAEGTAGETEETDGDTVKAERVVIFSDFYNSKHDVFFANIGDQELTGINVELKDAHNVKLDQYWTVGEDSVKKLAPFNTTERRFTDQGYYSTSSDAGIQNVAKVRLVPDPDSSGAVSGTLVISTENGGTTEIALTGISRAPSIVTTGIRPGVKYVHYSSVIQTDNMDDSVRVEFTKVGGELPEGMILKPNGELYGIPTETGTFTFQVKAGYTGFEHTDSTTATFSITINDNTNENVESQTTEGYELTERIPAVVTNFNQVFKFHSEGSFSEFMNIYKDGVLLVENEDYVVEEGSTLITIDDQTIGEDDSGDHTISAEFRTNKSEDGEMKVVAQNYTVDLTPQYVPTPGENIPTPPQPSQPSQPSQPDEPGEPDEPEESEEPETPVFTDVNESDWFYEDVLWAYKEGLLNGIGDSKYGPKSKTSTAMVVKLLSMIAKVDLTAYTGSQEDIPEGMWYTAAALWAREKGLIPSTFVPDADITRADIAVMLQKFLTDVMGDTSVTPDVKDFPDIAEMTEEEAKAFKFLFARGIFNGVDSNNSMNPTATSVRAELATLTRKICEYIETLNG